MISILSSFKPFRGDAARLQENALLNWRCLGDEVEIIIYGNGEGVADYSHKYDARLVVEIQLSSKGVPRFDAIANHAARHAKFDVQMYLNGDILLPPNFLSSIEKVKLAQFLLVGQRIDLTMDADFNVQCQDWLAEITRCQRAGHATYYAWGPSAVDYFVFRRGLWAGLGPLIIGRGRYDNILIASCLRRNVPIIDATLVLLVIHQFHDYGHLAGGNQAVKFGPDALENFKHHDMWHSPPDIREAGWQLKNGGVIKSELEKDFLRQMEMLLRFRHNQKYLSYLFRGLWRLVNGKIVYKRNFPPLEVVLGAQRSFSH